MARPDVGGPGKREDGDAERRNGHEVEARDLWQAKQLSEGRARCQEIGAEHRASGAA
jgi:hypothetical protein